MIKSLFIVITCLLYIGCSRVGLNNIQETEELSCDEKIQTKSLESLEQNYRCNF